MTRQQLDSLIERVAARNRTDGVMKRQTLTVDRVDFEALVAEILRLRATEKTP